MLPDLKRGKVILLAMVLFIVGCAEIKTEQPALPTPSITPTYWPASITPKPYRTLTPWPTRTPTPILFPLQATAYVYLDECRDFTLDISQIISPDQQWFVVTCESNDYTKIARFDGSREWHVPAIDNGFTESGEPLSKTYYKFYRWSVDGKHVYLKKYFCCIDGPSLIFNEAFGLYRFDLEMGVLDAEYNYTRFALSPDEQYYAFAEGGRPYRVIVRDLHTQDQMTFPLKEKYEDVGMFKWSPDGKNLIFVAALEGWIDESMKAGFSIFSYNLESRQFKILIDNDLRQLMPANPYDVKNLWINSETIVLEKHYGDGYWTLNVRTGELVPYILPKP